MSLTSRLSNLFSSNNSVGDSHETQRNGYSEPDLDFDGARQSKRLRTMENMPEEEVDFELTRPPYIHVCAWINTQDFDRFAHLGRSQCLPEALGARLVTSSCIL